MLPQSRRLPLINGRIKGKCVQRDSFHAVYVPNNYQYARFAVIIPKSAVTLATARNRLKRQLHGCFMRHSSLPPLEILIVVKKNDSSLVSDFSQFLDSLSH